MNEQWYVTRANEDDKGLVFVFKFGEHLIPNVRKAMDFIKEEPNGFVNIRMGVDDGSVYIAREIPASLMSELEQNKVAVLSDECLVKQWIEKNVWLYLKINPHTIHLAAKFASTDQWVTSVDVTSFVLKEMGIQ